MSPQVRRACWSALETSIGLTTREPLQGKAGSQMQQQSPAAGPREPETGEEKGLWGLAGCRAEGLKQHIADTCALLATCTFLDTTAETTPDCWQYQKEPGSEDLIEAKPSLGLQEAVGNNKAGASKSEARTEPSEPPSATHILTNVTARPRPADTQPPFRYFSRFSTINTTSSDILFPHKEKLCFTDPQTSQTRVKSD